MSRFAVIDTETDFKDVKESDWYYDTVVSLTEIDAISGYDDNTFRPDNLITRAEASSVLIRLIPGMSGISTTRLYSGVVFDPVWDIYKNSMSSFKAHEFLDKALSTLTVGREADGKYYISGRIPRMPEGYPMAFSAAYISLSDIEKVNLISTPIIDSELITGDIPFIGEYTQIPAKGSFKVELKDVVSLDPEKTIISITFSIGDEYENIKGFYSYFLSNDEEYLGIIDNYSDIPSYKELDREKIFKHATFY